MTDEVDFAKYIFSFAGIEEIPGNGLTVAAACFVDAGLNNDCCDDDGAAVETICCCCIELLMTKAMDCGCGLDADVADDDDNTGGVCDTSGDAVIGSFILFN